MSEQKPHYLGVFNIFHRIEWCGLFFTIFSCERPGYRRCVNFSLIILIQVGEASGLLNGESQDLSLYSKFSPGIRNNTDQCTNTFTEQNVGALAFPRPEYLIQRFSMFSVSWEEKNQIIYG